MRKRYDTFEEYLKHEYQGPYSATDILIRYNDGKKNGIVLITRKNFPHGLALPGGIAEKIALWENAQKEAKEETGLDIIIDDKEQPFCVLMAKDPRAFITSITYTAQGHGKIMPDPHEDAISAQVYSLGEINNLLRSDVWAFDHHKRILKKYLHHVGYVTSNEGVKNE